MTMAGRNSAPTIPLMALVVIQFVFAFCFWQSSLKFKHEIHELQELYRQQQYQNEVLTQQLTLQQEAIGKTIPPDVLVRNRKHDYFAFDTLLHEGSRLFLFFQPAGCSSCTTEIFAAVPDLIDLLGERIVFICTESNYNTLIEAGDYRIQSEQIFSVPRFSFSFLNDLPYFAEISPEGRYQLIFYLDNNNTGIFLNFIKSYYAIY